MRRFRVGLIPVRLVAPLVLIAVAVPIVIDLLKPLGEKIKEGFENMKPKDDEKPLEPDESPDVIVDEAAAAEAGPVKKPAARKPAVKKAPAAKAAPAPAKKPASARTPRRSRVRSAPGRPAPTPPTPENESPAPDA